MINLATLLRLFRQNEPLQTLFQSLTEDGPPEYPLGVPTYARPALLAALHSELNVPLFFIAARADRARLLADQIRLWMADPSLVHTLPDPGVLPYERVPWNQDAIAGRLDALTALAKHRHLPDSPPPVIISATRALMQLTAPPGWFSDNLLTYRIGQRIDMQETLAEWVKLGYQHRDIVEHPGEFSHRGGIMDIFPPSETLPVRLDLFGDEIDSLRTFEPLTQRSEARIKQVSLGPATEAPPARSPQVIEALNQLDLSRLQPIADLNLREDIVRLESETSFSGLENYLPLMYPAGLVTPLAHLSQNALIIIENPAELASITLELEEQAQNLKDDLVARQELAPDWPRPYQPWDTLEAELRAAQPILLGFDAWASDPFREYEHPFQRIFGSGPVFGGKIRPALQDLIKRRGRGERVVITSRQAARLRDLLEDEDVRVSLVDSLDFPPPPGSLTLFDGPVLEGWVLRPDGDSDSQATPALTLITDAELFGLRKAQPRRRPRRRRIARKDTFFDEVNPGDYVVHIEHGIGMFSGLVKLDFDGQDREYLAVEYNQKDKLYVPIHQADRLSRYVGMEDKPPTLNRLGTPDWGRTKKRTRAAVVDIADDLIRIYAAREVVKGREYAKDTPWQREMEAAFPYVETEDQLTAIAEVKQDMEGPRPMDRLVCGDVGYGKTEVALRAAFKAVMSGAQVAMLVPTTILAQQHFNTFKERLSTFPVTVEMLSRFRRRSEAKEVVENLKTGGVDIVIGTHRILQKDIKFKDLGLLVIDEEQRFGVSHKERLKEIRTNVDTLTLSATPIPRTLHMALTNVRDMSVIDTPPEERLPIKTTISPLDETLIRTAIRREMDRGGQVYFVHNRVMGIENLANYVKRLVPEANVTIGHGQMPERELERVMRSFAEGEHDVLVCTTIIESGLDIPNVNTIIINRADAFGLAQLYQLRGRVGRSAVQSYAYLLIPSNRALTELASKRLEAIQEADELGAGFKIAMRDLEIRGAGDLLGARQHGHISAVGFDLYVRLLTQAVQELKNRYDTTGTASIADAMMVSYLSPLDEDIQINLPMAVYIPEEYLAEENLRLKLYRRMANLSTLEEVAGMGQELEDRFGELPEPVVNLLYQLKLKVLCRAAGVKSVGTAGKEIVIRAETLEAVDRVGLERRLGVGARVARRQAWLPLGDKRSVWEADLENFLQLLGRMVNDPGR